ncbi:MAG: 1-(5-phosphoribosyl)-5-amino-4-imidazole-carboxylate carboxylase, partial [Planctomycetota bacterium]
MDQTPSIESLLEQVAAGALSAEDAAKQLHAMQAQPLGFATLDHHRAERCGSSEVIYAAGKTAEQVASISHALLEQHDSVLITRANQEQVDALKSAYASGNTPIEAGQLSGTALLGTPPGINAAATPIPVVTAGTSDLPVAEECILTCKAMGQPTEPINDV